VYKKESFPKPQGKEGGADLHFLSPQKHTSLHCRITNTDVSQNVPVYILAFAGTHCAYPQRDGQAELTCEMDMK